MKNVIITGVGGFLGGALAKKLLLDGYTVYGITSSGHVGELAQYPSFHSVQANFESYHQLHELLPEIDFDMFYHFAWNGVYGDSFRAYELQLNNAKYACAALEEAKKVNCRRFIFAGTYNEFELLNFIGNEMFEPRYTCIYATAKLTSELMCRTLAYQLGIEYSAGLVCMAYGERNYSPMLANIVLEQLLNGEEPKLISGENYYDLVYVDDVAAAFQAIGERGVNQKSYYVGHRKLKKFKDLFAEVRDIVNPSIQLRFGEYQDTSNLDYTKIDLDSLYRDTGFECKADLRESILKTAQWLKKQENSHA